MMRLVPGDPASDIEVIWYFAPRGAKLFPTQNAFCSSNWDISATEGPYQVGEHRAAPRTYYNGRNLWGYTGRCHVGTEAEWAGGLTATTFAARQGGALPTCCGPGGPVQLGQLAPGLAVLGIQRFQPGGAPACGSVANPHPIYWLDTRAITSAACDCGPLARLWKLVTVGPCYWQSAVTTWCGGLFTTYFEMNAVFGNPMVRVVVQGSGLVLAQWSVAFPLWSGDIPVSLPFTGLQGTCAWPDPIWVYPNPPPWLTAIAVAIATEGSAWTVPWAPGPAVGVACDGLFYVHGSMLGQLAGGVAFEGSAWSAPAAEGIAVGVACDGLFYVHGSMLGQLAGGVAFEGSAWT